MTNDANYFARRAEQETECAARATHPNARRIHALLADNYAQLAKRELATPGT
jgi:hypothetical protein